MAWTNTTSASASWVSVIGDVEKYLTTEDGTYILTEDDKFISIGNGNPETTWTRITGSSGGWTNV
jgi:hypothetical protein